MLRQNGTWCWVGAAVLLLLCSCGHRRQHRVRAVPPSSAIVLAEPAASNRAARIAIPLFEAAGLVTGDQQPYSGKLLNYTMDHHAEGKFPYLGIEVRQDQIKEAAGQQRYADIIAQIALQCSDKLA